MSMTVKTKMKISKKFMMGCFDAMSDHSQFHAHSCLWMGDHGRVWGWRRAREHAYSFLHVEYYVGDAGNTDSMFNSKDTLNEGKWWLHEVSRAMFPPPKSSSLTTSHTEMILSNIWISTSYFNVFECFFYSWQVIHISNFLKIFLLN